MRITKHTPISLLAVFLFGLVFAACDDHQSNTDADIDGDTENDADISDATDADADADGSGPDDLSELLDLIRETQDVPALAAAVVQGDDLVALGAAGVRKYGDETPVTVEDMFHLGSDTKAMTATLLASLVEEGVLDWETTFAEAFPDLSGCMDSAYHDVTLEQTLAHRAGITGSIARDFADLWNSLFFDTRPVDEQRADFAENVLCSPPSTKPGSGYEYSNAGYMIVGAAMEEATGQTWEALMNEHIFVPLGMTDCGFGPPASAATVDQPWGHTVNGSQIVPIAPEEIGSDNPAALGPAGTVHCSMRSWAQFASANLLGAQGDESFLPAQSWTRMHTGFEGSDYALGWGVSTIEPWSEGPVIQHAGSNTMFFAFLMISPSEDFAYMTAMNIGDDRALHTIGAVHVSLVEAYVGE